MAAPPWTPEGTFSRPDNGADNCPEPRPLGSGRKCWPTAPLRSRLGLPTCAELSAWFTPASATLRKSPLEELQDIRDLGGRWGKIVARRAFGDAGPGLDADLATLEQVAL